MAIEKKLICFARLEEFQRQLAAGNIKDYSIVLIQDAKKIYNRGTYYDCSGITQEQGDERYVRKITEDGMTVSGIDQIRNPSSGMTYAFSESRNGNENGIILTSDITKTINGQSLLGAGDITIEGGSADNVYIADFTVNDLLSIAGQPAAIQSDVPRLYDAVASNKIILVPYDAIEGFQGYGVAVGNYEDMIYLTVLLDSGLFIDLELDPNIDEIGGEQVTLRRWYDKQDRLVSGTNIKTINGESILGSGDIEIESGGEANVKSDWLETNSDSDSYVKNRTHYVAGTKITSAGSYSIGANTPIYYREKVYNLEIGVRTQIESDAAGVYVTLNNVGILRVESVGNYLETFPIIAVSGVVPLDDMFIPETVARTSELKTINGESIVGSGDIVISGGETLTESDIAAMGFTKNTGTYSKPSGGIPKSDLASAVQTSLGKADTALQSYTEQYKGTITGVSANGTSVATSGVANIPAASTSAYGVTKLSSATNSTSTTLAATASAVKAAYDLASGKASMSDVNTAIANAITTTLNTAV